MKSYTDLEQSKVLANILPIESADMYYSNVCPKGVMYSDSFRAGLSSYEDAVKMNKENIDFYLKGSDYKGVIAWEILPCWSLAALLKVLPNKIVSHETAFEDEDAEDINDIYRKHIELTEDDHYMCCYIGNGYKYKCVADNPVDACVAMIEHLHELKML